MKKTIYMLLIAFATAMTVSACTEDEINPTTEMNGGGGGVDDNK